MNYPRNTCSWLRVLGVTLLILSSISIHVSFGSIEATQIVVEGRVFGTKIIDGILVNVVSPSVVIYNDTDVHSLYLKDLPPTGILQVRGGSLENNVDYRLTLRETSQPYYQVIKIEQIEHRKEPAVYAWSLAPLVLMALTSLLFIRKGG